MRKALAASVATVSGLWMIADFFLQEPTVHAVGVILVDGAIIMATCALLLGALNLIQVHGRTIRTGEKRRLPSIALFVALVVTLILGLVSGPGSASFRWLFEYVYYPAQATIGSLLAFFIVTAAYRAFRLRSLDAIIITAVGLFLLIAQIPGSQTVWEYAPSLRDWIFSVPVTAGMRGLVMGTALGTITTGLRVLFWVDRPYS